MPSSDLATISNSTPIATTSDADATDDQLVQLWLHGRSVHTIRGYRRAIEGFRTFVDKPLRAVRLADLQAYADTLAGAASSRAQSVAAIKSLLSFAARLGVTPFNVGAALRKPPSRDTLPDRIIEESDVQAMLAGTKGRDHALIRLAYAGGFRVSELVAIRWSDLAAASDGTMFVTVFGKGGKTRTVRISAATAKVLRALRGDAPANAYVFPGRNGALDPSQVWRIVRAAARLAGIDKAVSPHFMRHAHASHALDRGAKLTTIRDTLGHSSIAVTDRYAHARPNESSGLTLAV